MAQPEPKKPSKPLPTEEAEALGEPPARLAIPSREACDKAKAIIQDIYKDELASSKTPSEKQALAKKLLADGQSARNDPAARYVLTQMAQEQAAAAGDMAAAFAAADDIAQVYDADALESKAKLAGTMLKSAGRQAARCRC